MLSYIYSRLVELNACINLVTENLESEIRPMIRYSMKNGQRLRPLLLITGYELSGKDARDDKDIIKIAASLEFLHKASLAHDDIVDEDEYRRGEKSIPGKFGSKKALILGDLLIAIAYRLLNSNILSVSQEKRLKSVELFNEIFFRLSHGEMMDILYEEKLDIPEQKCIKLMEDKTAIFIQNAITMGGILGEITGENEKKLSEYGKNLGLAFQLINDLNNCNGLEKELKKNFASDIAHGKKNILLVKALEDSSNHIYKKIMEIINADMKKKEVESIVNIIYSNDIVEKVKDKIEILLSRCNELSITFPLSPARKLLEYIPKNAYRKSFWKKCTTQIYA